MIYFQAWWCLCICIFPAWDEVNIFWFIFMTFNILLYLTIFHQKVGNLSFYSFAIKAGIGDLVVWFCLFFPYCSTVAGKLDKICSGTMKCFLIQNLTSKRFFNEIYWNQCSAINNLHRNCYSGSIQWHALSSYNKTFI